MKIGLALSGGGALGAAHIGVIEELEKNSIKIDCVCGVSAGATIGLAYSAGGLAGLAEFYASVIASPFVKKDKFLLAGGPPAAFKFVAQILEKITKGKGFSQLGLPFSCCVTNLASGEMEIIDSGDPVAAAMASSAYPVVFSPQKIDGKIYIDGGVTRNLPADETRKMGAQFVIGSSIYDAPPVSETVAAKMNPLEIALRSLNIFEKELSRFEEQRCDFCFKPRLQNCQMFDFFSIEKIVERGRQNAKIQIKDLQKILIKV